MSTDDNPYRSPAEVAESDSGETSRGGVLATVLIVVWLLEGSLKLFFVVPMIFPGGIELDSLAQIYGSIGRGWFVAGCTFFVFETIGPWFGLAYLVRCKQGKLTFEPALYRVLFIAGAISLFITASLVLSIEISLRTA